jgi:uncharacterized membrane protein
MKPEQLGRELRENDSDSMRRRRAIAALSLFNVASMGIITLYQMGVTKHVPLEPPLPGFDADKVNGSAQAYEILQTPDAALGLGSYAATLCLACLGEPARADTKPWAPLLLAAKAGGDALFAAKLLVDQPTKYKAACSWCIASACATFAVAALAIPEARKSWRNLATGSS